MATVRPPAVAGSFYPADAKALRGVVREYLDAARKRSSSRGPWPKALIVPHAGYMYSGPVAANAFVLLEPSREVVEHVVLLGPSHHIPFDGLAVPSNTAFETPLGRVPIDETARRQLLALPFVDIFDDAHHWEHSLEVQLPFLQEVLGTFAVLPIALGRGSPEQVDEVLEALWDGDETVMVISSDLSHYHDYGTAKAMDAATAAAIESLEPERITPEDACGRVGVQGLLSVARRRALAVRTLDLRSSGDTAGQRDEVVGYGAWALTVAKNGSP
ncbi:MAG: AmmeMemoRadiSam system protein B [Myxococcales bacterium]|nr:AmmeMemoRadiSam system protein B [Deltaproteobacteria bacterium]NOQ84819.1 AmmeMemoRadiSam system protein B [Myxococcales bacterium]